MRLQLRLSIEAINNLIEFSNEFWTVFYSIYMYLSYTVIICCFRNSDLFINGEASITCMKEKFIATEHLRKIISSADQILIKLANFIKFFLNMVEIRIKMQERGR